MAHPRLVLPDWLLPAHDVLHHRHRLDGQLLRQIPHRRVPCRDGYRIRCRRIRRDALEPRRDDALDGAGRCRGLPDLLVRLAEWIGARQQGHDARAACADRCARRPQPHAPRCGGGHEVLSAAVDGFHPEKRPWHDHRRRDEPVVLHAQPRHRGDGDLRQLYVGFALPPRRGRAHLRARHVRRPDGRRHHLPGLLLLRH